LVGEAKTLPGVNTTTADGLLAVKLDTADTNTVTKNTTDIGTETPNLRAAIATAKQKAKADAEEAARRKTAADTKPVAKPIPADRPPPAPPIVAPPAARIRKEAVAGDNEIVKQIWGLLAKGEQCILHGYIGTTGNCRTVSVHTDDIEGVMDTLDIAGRDISTEVTTIAGFRQFISVNVSRKDNTGLGFFSMTHIDCYYTITLKDGCSMVAEDEKYYFESLPIA
jgi:hypothetical protein